MDYLENSSFHRECCNFKKYTKKFIYSPKTLFISSIFQRVLGVENGISLPLTPIPITPTQLHARLQRGENYLIQALRPGLTASIRPWPHLSRRLALPAIRMPPRVSFWLTLRVRIRFLLKSLSRNLPFSPTPRHRTTPRPLRT